MKRFLVFGIVLTIAASLFVSGCFLKRGTPTTSSVPGSGVLNLSNIDPFTLDPAVANEAGSIDYVSQIFSGLLQVGDDLETAPDIAESLPEVSADGLTYTFRLRRDVKFHNGEKLAASDFKYSWERAASPSTGSQTAGTYLGDIVGVKEMLTGKANQISGVKVLDDYTLEVTIDSPKSYFLSKLTFPTSFAVNRGNVGAGVDWWRKPVGSGPFKLSEWTPNTSLTLERNSAYYGGAPAISKVKYQFYTGLPMDLYETGQIDATYVSAAYIDKVSDQSGPFYKELSINPEFSFSYLGFNCLKPPFDDINIRQAFSLAIDKDKIISLIYRDMVQKAGGVIPAGLPGYNANVVGLGYDANRAKGLIRSSQYGDVSRLPPIVVTTSGYGGGISPVLEAMIYQWDQNLGVKVKVRELEPERFYYNVKSEIDEMFDIGGWIADYAHPQDFVDILFHSNSDNNFGSYSNSQVDALVSQANQESDRQRSFSLYQQAEQLIVNDAACIPLTFGRSYLLVKPYVKGYSVNPQGIASLDKVSVESH